MLHEKKRKADYDQKQARRRVVVANPNEQDHETNYENKNEEIKTCVSCGVCIASKNKEENFKDNKCQCQERKT